MKALMISGSIHFTSCLQYTLILVNFNNHGELDNFIFYLNLGPCQEVNIRQALQTRIEQLEDFLTSEIQWHVISEGLYFLGRYLRNLAGWLLSRTRVYSRFLD